MAAHNPKLFLVFPTTDPQHPWLIRKDGPDGVLIARFDFLGNAVDAAEQLNAGRAFDRALARITVITEVIQ